MIQVDKIRESVYSLKVIGYLDVNFHGCIFPNEEGASYNAYLIVDEEVTLIDLVDSPYIEPFVREIKKIIGERPIDQVVVNHVEPDHAGGFGRLMELYPNAKCYCSAEAKDAMLQMFFGTYNFNQVQTGDELSVGSDTLRFVLTPFIHWPDNMMSYLVGEEILFSNDAFGSLENSNRLYDDQYQYADLLRKTKEYYANIVQPCSRFVRAKLAEFAQLNWPIQLVCPAHGIIWRSHFGEIFDQYVRWAETGDVKDKIVIIYDTIWDNTEIMANEIATGMATTGYEVRIFNASIHRKSMIMSELMDARGVLIGSSNFNNTMTPQIADILERMIGLKPLQKVGMAFGSYGWADVHLGRIENRLKEANVHIVHHAVYENYTPDEAEKIYAQEVGRKFVAKLEEMKIYG